MTANLISILSQFDAGDKNCKKVFCTTCWGKSYAFKQNATPEIHAEVKKAISEMSFREFFSISDTYWGGWAEFLYDRYTDEVVTMLNKEAESINVDDIRTLDRFLFEARKYRNAITPYRDLLDVAIKTAIKSKDKSLIESLIIILGGYIVDYEELYKVAIDQFKIDGSFHRALYNTVREQEPLVKGYVGDGYTFWF